MQILQYTSKERKLEKSSVQCLLQSEETAEPFRLATEFLALQQKMDPEEAS